MLNYLQIKCGTLSLQIEIGNSNLNLELVILRGDSISRKAAAHSITRGLPTGVEKYLFNISSYRRAISGVSGHEHFGGGGRQSLSREAENTYYHKIYPGETISLGCLSFLGYRHRCHHLLTPAPPPFPQHAY